MRRNTVCLLLYILSEFATISTLRASAQSIVTAPIDQPCVIPFRMEYQLIAIEVIINGVSGYLCIDTGTDGLVIRDTYFEKSRSAETFSSSNGGSIPVGFTYATVQFACHSKAFREARVMNLDHLMPHHGTRILGLAGWDAFKAFELQIDFRNSVIRLTKLDKKAKSIGNDTVFGSPLMTLSFRFKGRLPFVEALIGEEKLQLILDTGASVNVMHKSLQKRLAPFSSFVRMIRLRHWGGDAEMPLTQVSGVILGGISLDTMNTVWYDMSKLNRDLEGPQIDGILGQEFMKRYLVTINFTMREVSFYNYENVPSATVVNQDAERTSND